MTSKPMLTYDEVIELEDSLNTKDEFHKHAKLVWLAMTDWPNEINDTNEMLDALNRRINAPLTLNNITKYSDSLIKQIGISGVGWQLESITSLIELFEFYTKAETLNEIFGEFCKVGKDKLTN